MAVVDSGTDATHPDLEGRIAAQRDFLSNRAVAEDDFTGHGTHMAGIIAKGTQRFEGAASNNGWCRILIAKAFDAATGDGSGSTVAESLRWSVDSGAWVINVSLAGPDSEELESAVDYAADRNVLVVAAAGNQRTSEPAYPAAYPNVIAVAATDGSDQLACDSNFGAWVDLAAPGKDVLSAAPDGGYRYLSGTSQASAWVAALAANLVALGHEAEEIRSHMKGRPWIPEPLAATIEQPL